MTGIRWLALAELAVIVVLALTTFWYRRALLDERERFDRYRERRHDAP